MKNLPNKIYLQVDPENEKPEDFNDLDEVTWCKDKINDNDIPYYRHGNSNLHERIVMQKIAEDIKRLKTFVKYTIYNGRLLNDWYPRPSVDKDCVPFEDIKDFGTKATYGSVLDELFENLENQLSNFSA